MVYGTNKNIKSVIKNGSNFIFGISDPMFIVDKDLTIQYINDPALNTLGYTEKEVVGKMTCADLCKTPLCKTNECTIMTSMKSGEPVVGQTLAENRKGDKLPVRASCNAIYDNKGKPIGGYEIISDVRRLDEGFLSNMAEAAFRTDKNLVIQNINAPALKALGYTADEVIGKMTCADMCKTPLCGTSDCTINTCMSTKSTVVGTTVAERKDGTKIPVRASCGVLLDDHGNATGGFEIISDIRQVDEGFINNMADAAFRTDKNLVIQNINDAALKAMGYTSDEVIGKMTCADLCKTPLCNTTNCTIKNCMSKKTTIVGETVAMTKDGTKIPVRAACGVLLDNEGNPTGGFEVISDNTDLMQMIENLESVSKGDLTIEIDEKIKNRDDAVGKVANAADKMVDQLTDVVGNIVISAQNLAQAVDQISSGNQNLSQRTSEQASALEEIASTIEESTATIKQNADNASEANVRSAQTNSLAQEGGAVTTDAIGAINEINESSKKIGEIISVINEISFQTNLLALNAAVEAARAGEQGRGFAVVAGEVRNLAQRSSSAAKEIEDLIKDTLEKVGNGTELSGKSGEALESIIDSVKSVNKFVSEIAAASQEQRQGMDQINNAITEMDNMTQQNASLVEETASASEEMANQSQELLDMISQFKLNKQAEEKISNNKAEKVVHLKTAEKSNRNQKDKYNGNGSSKLVEKEKVPAYAAAASDKGNGGLNSIMKDEGFEEF